jgi:hypothetical protein
MNRDAQFAYVKEALALAQFALDENALGRVQIEFGRIADIAGELLSEPMPEDIEPLPTYRP